MLVCALTSVLSLRVRRPEGVCGWGWLAVVVGWRFLSVCRVGTWPLSGRPLSAELGCCCALHHEVFEYGEDGAVGA